MITISVQEFKEYYQQNGKHPSIVNSPNFDTSKISESLKTSENEPQQGININDLEIDVENIQSILPQMNEEQYLEYNQQKRIHHENFLRELNEKGLTLKNQPVTPNQQPTKKPMDY